MKKSTVSVKISIGVCFVLAGLLLILLIFGPIIFEAYMVIYRGFLPDGAAINMLKKVFGFCFYPSAIFASVILYDILKLLFNIKSGEIFINENVKHLKRVSYCCFVISLITFIGAFFYMPFGFVAMAAGFVGLLLRVLKNVMQSAVEISQENDLTI